MRRPVKPFVTEYRGTTRRQPGSLGQALSTEAEPLPRPAEPRETETSRFVAAQQEDSYEAALRAADALFSGARPSEQPRPFEPRSPRSPRYTGTHASPEPLAAEPEVVEARSGGRVLRVIDEPPLPEFAKLEAERAPKRRGRKPGSKNKPKASIAAITSDTETPVRAPKRLPRSANISVAPVAAIFTAPEPRSSVTMEKPAPPLAAPFRAATEASRGEKYAWVRTKLKPGERWKRRLPKIAW